MTVLLRHVSHEEAARPPHVGSASSAGKVQSLANNDAPTSAFAGLQCLNLWLQMGQLTGT